MTSINASTDRWSSELIGEVPVKRSTILLNRGLQMLKPTWRLVVNVENVLDSKRQSSSIQELSELRVSTDLRLRRDVDACDDRRIGPRPADGDPPGLVGEFRRGMDGPQNRIDESGFGEMAR